MYFIVVPTAASWHVIILKTEQIETNPLFLIHIYFYLLHYTKVNIIYTAGMTKTKQWNYENKLNILTKSSKFGSSFF